jgi:WD40 repeat protein
MMKNVTQYLEDQKNIKGHSFEEKADSLTSLGTSNFESGSENEFSDSKKKKGADGEQDDKEQDAKLSRLGGPDINDLLLVWEDEIDMIMMICTNAREYIVYDESDPEQSKILRRVSGGHQEEITILAYDFHLSLVATGCINGEIAVYDFEMSKCEGLLHGHTGDITALEFMAPYPLLLSASMDTTVCIWGVRPCPSKLQYVCVKRFQNLSWKQE